MNKDLERKLLIDELAILGKNLASGVTLDADFVESLSVEELRVIKTDYERLARSLGGTKND